MWKHVNFTNLTPLRCYSSIRNDFLNEIMCFIKLKPVNCMNIRYQSTKSSNISSHTLAKPPPPQYVKYTQPPKHERKISIGEYLLLTVPIGTFALGTWQVQRRNWKLKLIEDLEKRMNEPPISLPEDLSELTSLEYRKIKVKGRFDHEHEVYLGPRSLISKGESASEGGLISAGARKTAGHLVIAPFILSDSGQRILVNRGWVPTSSLHPSKRPEGQIEDEVELVGVVRLHEERGIFTPKNLPHIRIYHYRDLKKMARKTNSLPVFLDACEDSTVSGGPVGGQTNVVLRNEHMSYIITWYSLSALTTLMWCKKFLFK